MEDSARTGERPFFTRHDLQLTDDWLAGLEAQERLFASRLPFELPQPDLLDLTGCLPADAGDLTLAGFFLTALANRLLGGDFLPQPLPAVEISKLHAIVCTEQIAELRAETVQWVEQLEAGAGTFANYCFEVLEEFCAVPAGQIDPRFIRGLIVQVGS